MADEPKKATTVDLISPYSAEFFRRRELERADGWVSMDQLFLRRALERASEIKVIGSLSAFESGLIQNALRPERNAIRSGRGSTAPKTNDTPRDINFIQKTPKKSGKTIGRITSLIFALLEEGVTVEDAAKLLGVHPTTAFRHLREIEGVCNDIGKPLCIDRKWNHKTGRLVQFWKADKKA